MNPPYPCLGVVPNGFCPYTPTFPARECTSGASWWGSQYQRKPWPTGWGNAMYWPGMARRSGFTVNASCAPNTIMCIPPWTNGAGPKGHVAFVTGEPVNGRVAVIEMNFLIEYGFDYRTALVAGCEYIHLTAPDPPPPPPTHTGVVKPMLYQLKDGTIFLVCGNTKVPLGSGADATYYAGKGIPFTYEKDITALAAANLAKLPTV